MQKESMIRMVIFQHIDEVMQVYEEIMKS